MYTTCMWGCLHRNLFKLQHCSSWKDNLKKKIRYKRSKIWKIFRETYEQTTENRWSEKLTLTLRSGELKINKFLKDMTYLSIMPHSWVRGPSVCKLGHFTVPKIDRAIPSQFGATVCQILTRGKASLMK